MSSSRARRLGGASALLGLLALTAAGLATAGSPPGPTPPGKPATAQLGKIQRVGQSQPGTAAPTTRPAPVIGYRLFAKLAPSSGTSSASGRWDGVLVHTLGPVQPGKMPSIPGCTVTGPKQGSPPQAGRTPGIPHKIKCPGPVPPFTVPGNGGQWILGWRLTYSNLSSAVTGTDIRLNSPGAAGALVSTLCSVCTSGMLGRITPTDDQAAALLKGNGFVVVRTANNPTGEISGQIVKLLTPNLTAKPHP